jgi:DNA-binding NtrC family response regulator
MTESVLSGKSILAVDDETDVLTVLEEEITLGCSECTVDKATSYETAAEKLNKNKYDIVILDIMGVRGFDLLELSTSRGFRTIMLTANALTPESLKKSHDLGARAFLPKDKLGEVVPFLVDVLTFEEPKSAWNRIMKRLEDYFDARFEKEWKKKYPLSW